jgi:hypothetical protein
MRSLQVWSSCLASSPVVASAAVHQGQGTPDDRSQGFRPVEGGGNVASGEVLLVEAYAAFWLVLFGLLIAGWRKQKKLDARIRGLQSDLERAREGGDPDAPKLAKPR